MGDAAERRKRLKLMREEAKAAQVAEPGSAIMANPLNERQQDNTPTPTSFSFYSDPIAMLQARPAAAKQALRQSLGNTQAGLSAVTQQFQAPQAPSATTAHQHSFVEQPGPSQQYKHQPHMQTPMQAVLHQQPHSQPFSSQGQGRGTNQQSWSNANMRPPVMVPAPSGPPGFGPQPPPGPPPGPRPPPFPDSHMAAMGQQAPGFMQGFPVGPQAPPGLGPGPPARGRGRGRGRYSQGNSHSRGGGRGRGQRDAGAEVNIEAYASPAMLQDPWAALMQQYLQPTALQQPDPGSEAPVDSSNKAAADSLKGAGTGRSMSEAFDVAEQEAHALDQGSLAEEGAQDRPWH